MLRTLVLFLCLHSQPLWAGDHASTDQAVVDGVTLTAKALAAELKAYVERELTVKGAFLIQDPERGGPVALQPAALDDGSHIHRLGLRSFLSWGEFKAANGDLYLLDFYLDWDGKAWRFSAPLSIYSLNKVKRYAWDEGAIYMKKKPAPDTKKTAK
jgi:hypothetical protein